MDRTAELTPDVLLQLRRLTIEADSLIETCVRDRLSLRTILDRFLPSLAGWVGARGALLRTRNEHLEEDTFSWGAWASLCDVDLHAAEGEPLATPEGTALWTRLRVAGNEVGRIVVLVDAGRAADAAMLHVFLDAVCSELDVVLATIHIAADKQRLIVDMEEILTDPVFDRGVDRAVAALNDVIPVS